MPAVVVATHGRFSEELVKSSEMIFGKQENVEYITFMPGEGTEDLTRKYSEAIKALDIENGLIFLVDLFGGSPFNAATSIVVENENMDIVTGVNLPMLLEVFGARASSSISELVKIAENSGKESIRPFKEGLIINKNINDDDEEVL
ncbi:PTS sugar transporter subunit IIA [Clostridium intestinale]|uniref:PTS mannose transporter subunit IID n=1 Tax=Clostridium intestinale TaxID=36845 RepID=A0A7D6VRE2_9CLOT|nr:mannose/fructose/sorbose PTS transporter subunit IIA [Clostridium intestinale]QLY80346.1 PTS mannose transporter subunit IID [Clostridium intestinale]